MSKGNSEVPQVRRDPNRSTLREKMAEAYQRVSELEYGEVRIVVHQGEVTEIQTTRRERF